VHTALQNAIDEAGIECPFPTQTLNIQMNSEAAEKTPANLPTIERRNN
jgi:hypothetical protein